MRLWPWTAIKRLTIENWQLKAALGYGIPSALERDIEPNPFQCGICDARRRRPWLFRNAELNPVEIRLIKAAMRLNSCSAEFDGDISVCQEHLDEFYDACDAYQRAKETMISCETS
jgi:hypothetical protein